MQTSDELRPGERVKDVYVTEDTLSVDLIDGRTIIVPFQNNRITSNMSF